jgi:hypothetical protein
MLSSNEIRLHNLNAVSEVVESNGRSKRKQRGNGELSRGYKILGAAISAINRKNITDPKKKKREIEKYRKNIK